MGTSLVDVVFVALGPGKSSFEFIWISSFSELAKMLMPSLTCLSKHFLYVLSTLTLEPVWSLTLSGWTSFRCLANALDVVLLLMEALWLLNLL